MDLPDTHSHNPHLAIHLDRANNMCEGSEIIVHNYKSPCGILLLGSIDDKLCLCDWQVEKHHDKVVQRIHRATDKRFITGTTSVISQSINELDEYFSGIRKEFSIPLKFIGSEFQKQVWKELLNVPYGTTVSYREIARSIFKPTAIRAVANANGANALSIFVPCHRIIGSDNSLTGYGGGLHIKKFLLDLEKSHH